MNRTWITLSVLAALSTSTAALAARQLKAPEMYAATDAEAGEPSVMMSVPHPIPMAINPSARKMMNTPTPTHPIHSAERPAQQLAGQAMPHQAAPTAGVAYDPVPSDQVDGMSRRLKLVEELIRRHGRAYDYRVHTVRELESVLGQLDGARKASAPVAAPSLVPPATAPAALPTPTEEDEANN